MNNYIYSLKKALSNAESSKCDIKKLYYDFEICEKNLNFLLSDDKLRYEMEEELVKRTYIRSIEICSDESIHFVLNDLLPHRLDYHDLGSHKAARINHAYFSGFQRDAFEFIKKNHIIPVSKKMFLLFVNYYNIEENRDWDNDNLDVKVFIDSVISKKFIIDDNHELLSYGMLSRKGELTHTEAYLVEECNISSLFKQLIED